jgi:hypothetical protein
MAIAIVGAFGAKATTTIPIRTATASSSDRVLALASAGMDTITAAITTAVTTTVATAIVDSHSGFRPTVPLSSGGTVNPSARRVPHAMPARVAGRCRGGGMSA